MRQRVVLSLALAAEPRLIIADEPTTALDVSVQAQIIALLRRLCRQHGVAVLLITHDMGVIAETADRVAVMYAGRIVEIGPVRDVLASPLHPYTEGLIGSIPTLDSDKTRLVQIPGSMPRLTAIPPGCAFHPRCPRAFAPCLVERPELIDKARSAVACWLYRAGRRGGTHERGAAGQGRESRPYLRRVAPVAQPPDRATAAAPAGRGRRRDIHDRPLRDLCARRRVRLRQDRRSPR